MLIQNWGGGTSTPDVSKVLLLLQIKDIMDYAAVTENSVWKNIVELIVWLDK